MTEWQREQEREQYDNDRELLKKMIIGVLCFLIGMAFMYLWLASNGEILSLVR